MRVAFCIRSSQTAAHTTSYSYVSPMECAMLIKYSLWLFIEPERGGLVADSVAGGEADWGCGMGGSGFVYW